MGTPRPEIAAIIARYCVLLEELGIHVEQAILYGSHARGEARDGSDIDVLIISADFADAEHARAPRTAWHCCSTALATYRGSLPVPLTKLSHVEPATLLDEILQTGVRVA